jgi:uncharacterized protein YqeY
MLKKRIESDFNGALKQKELDKVSILRIIKADILNKEKEKRYQLSKEKPGLKQDEAEKESTINDEEILDIISLRVKKGRESVEMFEKGQRQDLIEKEKAQIEVLQSYLPKQLSEQEIKKLAQKIIKEQGAVSIKDMGKVMARLMPELKGRADGSMVSATIRELLS